MQGNTTYWELTWPPKKKELGTKDGKAPKGLRKRGISSVAEPTERYGENGPSGGRLLRGVLSEDESAAGGRCVCGCRRVSGANRAHQKVALPGLERFPRPGFSVISTHCETAAYWALYQHVGDRAASRRGRLGQKPTWKVHSNPVARVWPVCPST